MNSSETKYPHGCFLPMNALTVHPQGDSHFCLTSKLSTSREPGVLNEGRLSTQKSFLNGEWPESCLKCHNKEVKDLESRRLRTWSRKTRMYGSEKALALSTESTTPALRHLDISFSNVCNLSCAMCSSEYSTGWIQHDKKAVAEGLEFRNFTSIYEKPQRISPELFNYVMEQVDNIDVIIIKGGEPTKDPQALEFLQRMAKKKRTNASIFIQSNGTTAPDKWLSGLEDLPLEMGISMDGWGEVFNWVRGPHFEQVLENIHALNKKSNIKSISVDFTLSAFNVLHLPEFLKNILQLQKEVTKITSCPVFQWVQQPYANPLTVPLSLRQAILEKSLPMLEEGKNFFLDSHFLINLLQKPRTGAQEIETTKRWYSYLKSVRGFSLGETESLLDQALASTESFSE